MSIYREGTVSVTNGSNIVTGAGTEWYGAMGQGWLFNGPDGALYVIDEVNDSDTITLHAPYAGGTAGAQSYFCFATQTLGQDLVSRIQDLFNTYQTKAETVLQGRFTSDLVSNTDRDTGMRWLGANHLALIAGNAVVAALKAGQLGVNVQEPSAPLEVLGTPGVLAKLRDGVASNFQVETAGNKTTIGNAAGSSRLALMAGNREAIEFDTTGRASGAAVQSDKKDVSGHKLVFVEGAKAATLAGYGLYYPSGGGENIDDAVAGDCGLYHDSNPGTWPMQPSGSFVYLETQRIYTNAAVRQTATYGYDSGTPLRVFTRLREGSSNWEDWKEFFTLDGAGRTDQNVEIRNNSPFLAITDLDTGAKHVFSGNSTAGHLYLKTDPNEVMPNSALLIETQANRQMIIAKDDVEFLVQINAGPIVSKAQLFQTGYQGSTGSTGIKIGSERTGDGASHLDFIGDTAYHTYGARLIRYGGENGSTQLLHRGTGSFQLNSNEAANILIRTDVKGLDRAVVMDPLGNFRPNADNEQSCGSGSFRWSQFYAASGTINTSDALTKTDIQDLDAAECRVAVVAKSLLKKYRMRDAVAKKGDAARWHFGIIAQELAAAFEAEGLDPWRYGMLCWDEWWSAEVEIPAETTPIMEEVEEEVTHTVTVDEPVLDEHGAPTGEVEQVEKEVIELVKKQVETGELEILMEARTELQTFASAEAAPEGAEYHNRQGVRYDELFAFILAAM